MLSSAFIAYAHYLSVFGVVVALTIEALTFGQNLSLQKRRILGKADTVYGIAAILVLITGFTRVYFFGKGPDYYFSNSIFLSKLGLFIVVGILSAYPTVVFLKWRKAGSEMITLDRKQYLLIRRLINLEIILVLTLPLLAAMMARGMGS